MKNRDKAKLSVETMTKGRLQEIIIAQHAMDGHRWMEVYPDGEICEAHEAGGTTTHWIDYPEKAVEKILEICNGNAPCNCDVCTAHRDRDEMGEDEFREIYGDAWDGDSTLSEDILDKEGWYAEELRDEMIIAIGQIPYGYFDDENDNDK